MYNQRYNWDDPHQNIRNEYSQQQPHEHQSIQSSSTYAAPAYNSSAPLIANPSALLQQTILQQQQALLSALQAAIQTTPTTTTIPAPGFRFPAPREPCRDFLAGKCNRGINCKFVHPMPMMPAAALSAPREACADFLRGKCNRTTCKFAHAIPNTPRYPPTASLAVSPLALASYLHPVWDPSVMYEQSEGMLGEMCRDYKRYDRFDCKANLSTRGLCTRGDSCRFVHENHEDGARCRDFLHGLCERGNSCKFLHAREVCRDYTNGVCKRGAGCKFLHTKEEPCRNFLNGTCTRGDTCKYYHAKPSSSSSHHSSSRYHESSYRQRSPDGHKRKREDEEKDPRDRSDKEGSSSPPHAHERSEGDDSKAEEENKRQKVEGEEGQKETI